jgi:hypothetical protein
MAIMGRGNAERGRPTRRTGVTLMDQLAGKVAVITGSASGLGRGMAERFAQEGMRS